MKTKMRPKCPHQLSSRELKAMSLGASEPLEKDWWDLVLYNRLFLLEVCCSPNSVLAEHCLQTFGPQSAERLAQWNGGDVETAEGRKLIKSVLREKRPRVVWLSPECGPYSPMQRLNQRNPQQRLSLEEKRSHARKQYEGICEIAKEAHQIGSIFVVELSEKCEAWSQSWVQELEALGAVTGVCHGCQVGLKNPQGELLHKGWKLLGNCEEVIRHMTLKCPGNHKHGLCEGKQVCRTTAYYTPQFAARFLGHFSHQESHVHLVNELMDGAPGTQPMIASPQAHVTGIMNPKSLVWEKWNSLG